MTATDSTASVTVGRIDLPPAPRWWMCDECGNYWNAQHSFEDSGGKPPVPHRVRWPSEEDCHGPIVGLVEVDGSRYGGETA